MLDIITILLMTVGSILTIFGVYSILATIKLLGNPQFWRSASIIYTWAMVLVYIIMLLYVFGLLGSWGWTVFLAPITTGIFGFFALYNLWRTSHVS